MLNVSILNVVMLSVIMLSVVMMSFVEPFQPSPMLMGKARSLPSSGAPKICSGLTQKH
jgi:hypothetical protein